MNRGNMGGINARSEKDETGEGRGRGALTMYDQHVYMYEFMDAATIKAPPRVKYNLGI